MKNPPPIGEFLLTEIVEAYGLTVSQAAAALRVPRATLSRVLNGTARLSGEMALRVEKAFRVPMDTLLRMQAAHEIAQAVEALYGVKVSQVRTIVVRGKMKRFGKHSGKRSNWKKAYITLAQGSTLNLYETPSA